MDNNTLTVLEEIYTTNPSRTLVNKINQTRNNYLKYVFSQKTLYPPWYSIPRSTIQNTNHIYPETYSRYEISQNNKIDVDSLPCCNNTKLYMKIVIQHRYKLIPQLQISQLSDIDDLDLPIFKLLYDNVDLNVIFDKTFWSYQNKYINLYDDDIDIICTIKSLLSMHSAIQPNIYKHTSKDINDFVYDKITPMLLEHPCSTRLRNIFTVIKVNISPTLDNIQNCINQIHSEFVVNRDINAFTDMCSLYCLQDNYDYLNAFIRDNIDVVEKASYVRNYMGLYKMLIKNKHEINAQLLEKIRKLSFNRIQYTIGKTNGVVQTFRPCNKNITNESTCYICLEDIEINDKILACRLCKSHIHLSCAMITKCGVCRRNFS
jgi:hypothetical protein